MRIDKFLSECKVATRRESGAAIRRGQVLLDGAAVKRADTQVDPEKSEVIYCGVRVLYRRYTYVLLNKPDGVVSATADARERTVLDLLPPEVRKFELFPCGRLDKNTLGLVLLTDNGPLAHTLLSPKRHVEKVYRFECAHPLTAETVKKLEGGVDIGGYVTKPCTIRMDGETAGEITLSEGKYHQIKLMWNAVDNRILYLERIRFANLTPDGLAVGRVLRDLLGDDVTRARQRGGGVRHVLSGIDEVRRRFRERLVVPLLAGEDEERQRLQPPLARDRRAGLALLLIREVHVLQLVQRLCRVERRPDGGGQLALRVDGGADLLAARLKAAQIIQPLDERAQLHVIEAAGRLLAVARDERDRVAVVVQLNRLFDLPAPNAELIGQNLQNIHVSFPFPQVF